MSKYTPQEVSEWNRVYLESGIVRAFKVIDGRTVNVYVSDYHVDGELPQVMGRYLLNYGKIITDSDGNFVKMVGYWVTRDEFIMLCKETGRHIAQGGIEVLQHIIAKVFDILGEKVKDRSLLLSTIYDYARDKVEARLLDEMTVNKLIDVTL